MKQTLKQYSLFLFVAAYIFMPLRGWLTSEAVYEFEAVVSPHEVKAASSIELEAAKPLEFDNQYKQYVYEKFGDSWEDAFKIVECESNWNIDAINDNTTWGGIGRDHGLFQVNDVYHPVQELQLDTDWRANVDYAHRMWKNDDKTFVRWTCNDILGL